MRKSMSMALLLLCSISVQWFPALAERTARTIEPMPIPNVKVPVGYQKPEVKETPSFLKDSMKKLQERIYANWEPSRGMLPNIALPVEFIIQPDGTFSNVKLPHPTGIAQVDFAAVEAIAESSKFVKNFPEEMKNPIQINLKLSEKTSSTDCATQYRLLHPDDVSNDEIVWHLIPLDALQCSKGLPYALVHSQQNLRVIKKSLVNSRELESARSDWVEYFRNKQNPSAAEITAQARFIEKKYAGLFEKKGPDNAGP